MSYRVRLRRIRRELVKQTPRQRRRKWGGLDVAVVVALILSGVFAAMAVSFIIGIRGASRPRIAYGPLVGRTDGDNLDTQLWAYGYPDEEESTEHDNPRPPMVSKFLIYRKERVEMLFVAEFPFGSNVPHIWTCVGALDPETKESIGADETFQRLKTRKNPASQ